MKELTLSEYSEINGGSQESYEQGVSAGRWVRARIEDALAVISVLVLMK